MRIMLRDLPEEEGDQTAAEAADGVEAVENYRQCRPELTTPDIVMPEKTGSEALKEIIAFDRASQVVRCSAIGQESLNTAAAQAGAKAFIVKPSNPELVAQVLKQAAEG
jgi:two-component system, chemotaxis family, chemotaxis protein CheY